MFTPSLGSVQNVFSSRANKTMPIQSPSIRICLLPNRMLLPIATLWKTSATTCTAVQHSPVFAYLCSLTHWSADTVEKPRTIPTTRVRGRNDLRTTRRISYYTHILYSHIIAVALLRPRRSLALTAHNEAIKANLPATPTYELTFFAIKWIMIFSVLGCHSHRSRLRYHETELHHICCSPGQYRCTQTRL